MLKNLSITSCTKLTFFIHHEPELDLDLLCSFWKWLHVSEPEATSVFSIVPDYGCKNGFSKTQLS